MLLAGIEDDQQNYTRFLLISRSKKASRGEQNLHRFCVAEPAGGPVQGASVFALRDIDLGKIESRPLRGHPWEYVFFVDIRRGDDEASRNALRHLAEIAEFVKVLGIYPAAKAKSV